MSKQGRRVQKKEPPLPPSFEGEGRAPFLVRFLNLTYQNLNERALPRSIQRTHIRIARALRVLVGRLHKLEALIYERGGAPVPDEDPEIGRCVGRINMFLRRYKASPVLPGGGHVRPLWEREITWTCWGDAPFGPGGWVEDHSLRSHEFQLALLALDLAKLGRISALRRCEQCHEWMYAKFSHQRFCSDRCKEQFQRTSETNKRRRRDWAKKNYWTRKVLETGSLNVMKGKKTKRVKKVK